MPRLTAYVLMFYAFDAYFPFFSLHHLRRARAQHNPTLVK